MKFLKPKFWEKKQISLFSVILFPISFFIIFVNYFKSFFIRGEKFPITIICVGNIYLGGTGKTPLCIRLFHILKKLNKKSVFIRKKYAEFQDEINLLKLTGPLYENLKRKKAIDEAIQNKYEIAILDDGFQDYSIKKDLSIICFNEKQWIGNGLTIPSGPLREKLSNLIKANCVIINGKKNINIEKKIKEKNNEIKIFYSEYKPINIDEFKEKRIICFAGIGNPINFFDLLKENKINAIEKISFPDHYDYSQKQLENLIKKSEKSNAILLTTEKDYLRIDKNYRKNINFLKISVEIKNENEFIEEIKKII